MPVFSNKGIAMLNNCHKDLQILMFEVIKFMDITIVCTHRGKAEQDKAFAEGKSKLQYPKSKHNKLPSDAIDVQPYPMQTGDPKKQYLQFVYMGGFIKGLAAKLYQQGIIESKIIWGGDWNDNIDIRDNDFMDLYHFERKKI